MNYLDAYYRALIDYRKNTLDEHDCLTQRSTTAKANAKGDIVTLTRQICDIETDWIEAIEEGLVHVDKAIREDRQFIRSNGEVVDIEKVKNVSKDSVEHLARHSNLITRHHEGNDIVPDRLYTVERLSDYAVYENKFLYMLLCYLRDFITVRYNKILDLEHTYKGELSMDKTVVMTKRKIDFKISLNEEKKDDPYLKEQSKSRDTIRRISDILELTHAALATPLMQEVAKVPMLKPPVTKTNVLRMNHNFRGALALYEYITAYDKDGYTVRTEEQKITPFKLDMADEFSEIVLLSSFLTYEYSLNLKERLRKEYDNEEARRREEEIKRHLEHLKALKRRIKESGESPDEYMLMLERVNRMLEQNTQKLKEAKDEIQELNNEILAHKARQASLSDEISMLNHNIDELKIEHLEKLNKLEEEKNNELIKLENDYKADIEILKEEHSDELQRICDECDNKVEEIKCKIEEERIAHESAIDSLKEKYENDSKELEARHQARVDEIKAEWHSETDKLNEVCKGHVDKIAQIEEENAKITEARRLAEARVIALRQELGITTQAFDFTSEEAFEELEHQLDVFESFFFNEWKKTKASIRKNVIKDFFRDIKLAKIRRKSEAVKQERKAKLAPNEKESAKLSKEAPKNEAPNQEPIKAETPKAEVKNEAPKKEAPQPLKRPVPQPYKGKVVSSEEKQSTKDEG